MLSPLHLPLALFRFPSCNAVRAQGDQSPRTALCICHVLQEVEERPGAAPACLQAAGVQDGAVLELP